MDVIIICLSILSILLFVLAYVESQHKHKAQKENHNLRRYIQCMHARVEEMHAECKRHKVGGF